MRCRNTISCAKLHQNASWKKDINLYYSSIKVIAYCILLMDYTFELPIQIKGLKPMCIGPCAKCFIYFYKTSLLKLRPNSRRGELISQSSLVYKSFRYSLE